MQRVRTSSSLTIVALVIAIIVSVLALASPAEASTSSAVTLADVPVVTVSVDEFNRELGGAELTILAHVPIECNVRPSFRRGSWRYFTTYYVRSKPMGWMVYHRHRWLGIGPNHYTHNWCRTIVTY